MKTNTSLEEQLASALDALERKDAEIEALQARVAELQRGKELALQYQYDAEQERDSLAALRPQEPVALASMGQIRYTPPTCDFDTYTPLYAKPVPPVREPLTLPSVCDGKEQEAFEAWAVSEHYNMQIHPLHYLFLNGETNAARQAWKAAINYCEATIKEQKC